MTFTLTPEGPLDVTRTLERYHRWGDDPCIRFAPGRFRRALRVGPAVWAYEVTWRGAPDDTRLDVRIPGHPDERVRAAVEREVVRVLGLDADLVGFYRMAKADRVLGDLVGPLYGLRPSLASAPLEMLVGSVCAQQVNLAFAVATRARIVRRYGEVTTIEGETVHAFPSAAVLGQARLGDLRRLKLSSRKAEYIRDIARALADGRLDAAELGGRDNDAVIAALTRFRGFGRWSAEWYLARYAGRGDVCPAGDLAVRKAFAHFYNRGRDLREPAIRRRARAWGEYQNLAIHYLLAGLRLTRPAGGGA
jgi:DNA-3-methyladenine glycosylase II